MMLHEEGRFSLDDPVAKFIPEFKNVVVSGAQGAPPRAAAQAMTVRDLLLHTSGLNARTSEIYRREQVRTRTMTMAQFIANLVRVPLMEDPGTRYRYSEGTTVLGRLVEIWSGRALRGVPRRAYLPAARHDRARCSGRPRPSSARGSTTVYGPAQGGGLTQVETETLPFTERPTLIEGAVGLAVNRARLPPIQSDAAQQGRARRRAHAEREDGGDDDAERAIGGRAEDARRIDGLGPGERAGRAESNRRRRGECRRVQDGTARPARSSGSIPAKRWWPC